MSVIVKKTGDFVPPPQGVHAAVCVDVADKGVVETPWGPKHKISIVWELEAKMPDGKPFLASKWYTAALNDKSNLFKDLQSWRGKAFTPEELNGFDVEKVIGASCQLVIVHAAKKDGSVRGNVTAIVKADRKVNPSGTFVRAKDKPAQQPQNGQPQGRQPGEEDGGGIPF